MNERQELLLFQARDTENIYYLSVTSRQTPSENKLEMILYCCIQTGVLLLLFTFLKIIFYLSAVLWAHA